MPEKKDVGCARPTGGVVGEPPATGEVPAPTLQAPQGGGAMVMVGKKAPDFEAPAYFNGEFVSVKLSEYLGKWVTLCFYPGDFTFV